MRNKHKIELRAEVRCPKEGCGYFYERKFTVEYVTNQKGDVIEHRIY